MDGSIPRRRFLQSAGAATTAAAVALGPRRGNAAEQIAEDAQPPAVTPMLAQPKDSAQPKGEAFDPAKFVVMHQLVQAGHAKMKPIAWNYLLGCADTETTMRRNRHALDSVAFKPRALRGVGKVDTRGKFLGKTMRLPVLMSGIGSVGLIDPGGAATVAKAASTFGVAMGYSSVAKPGLEETAAAGNCPKIVQLYVRGDDAWIDAYAERAIKAGYDAFAFIIDSAHFSRRERDIIHAGNNANLSDEPDPYLSTLDWDKIKRFKDRHKNVAVGLKGITTGEDAELGLKAGVSVIWVSTHGGRQVDHARGAYEILPEIVQAAKGKATIVFDSGVYRGTDVVKALATGADIVGIGRLYAYGLANGEAGVVRVLEILEKEIEACMANLGAKNVAALNKSLITASTSMNPPGLFSAFPLMDTTGLSSV
ncbi:MAG TPA: alpha-hydroxy acid oxidase [Stellaceae bacterium]|jgi:glycolate oxidase|nr:alpha-hydroxy acid oxidase [Stellaceae bacterium]